MRNVRPAGGAHGADPRTGPAAVDGGRGARGRRAPMLRAYLLRWKFEVGMFFDGVGPDFSDADWPPSRATTRSSCCADPFSVGCGFRTPHRASCHVWPVSPLRTHNAGNRGAAAEARLGHGTLIAFNRAMTQWGSRGALLQTAGPACARAGPGSRWSLTAPFAPTTPYAASAPAGRADTFFARRNAALGSRYGTGARTTTSRRVPRGGCGALRRPGAGDDLPHRARRGPPRGRGRGARGRRRAEAWVISSV